MPRQKRVGTERPINGSQREHSMPIYLRVLPVLCGFGLAPKAEGNDLRGIANSDRIHK